MPLYEYECPQCGPFTAVRELAKSSHPAQCVQCGQEARKIFSIINFRTMAPRNRVAHERNERSAHSPHICGSGCNHHNSKVRRVGQSSDKPVLQSSTKRYRRPWMLGH